MSIASASSSTAPGHVTDRLADFSTNRRVLLLSALAVPIGVIGAFVAKALIWLIAVFTNAAFFLRLSSEPVMLQGQHFGAWGVAVPVIGGLIIGLMARYGSEKIRGHGIPEALEAILLGRSLINPKVAILKPVSSAISIGTGGPFGAEGPIIMTGGAFGSMFAQLFHLTAAERKTLLVAGAAAGMAAVFATPIAAVLLAVELLLFEWKPRSFIPVAAAAVVASVMRVPLLGSGPIFPVTLHGQLGAEAVADREPSDRQQHRAADALHDARGDELAQRLRVRAEHRAEREGRDRDEEDALRAKAIGEPAGRRNQHRHRQRIGDDDRLHAQRRFAEARRHRRQRGVDDRRIQHLHEDAERDEPEQRVVDALLRSGGVGRGHARETMRRLRNVV